MVTCLLLIMSSNLIWLCLFSSREGLFSCKGLVGNVMQLYKPKWTLISLLFCLVGSWSVSSRHHESCSQLCEEGEGENSSLPGPGFAFCGCEVWVSSLPTKSPWNHKSSSSPKGLCPQVSVWKLEEEMETLALCITLECGIKFLY